MLSPNCHALVISVTCTTHNLWRVKNAAQQVVKSITPNPSRLRLALITETYPPEVNGVAMTWGNLVRGLRQRGHIVQIVRPCQANEALPRLAGDPDLVLARGIPIPRYPDLRFGWLAQRRLVRLWQKQRPDVVHVVTEGPLGWCAIGAARQLQVPLTSSFHTNFHQYSRHYGMGLLRMSIEAYLRRFHNRTLVTLAPTQAAVQSLSNSGFRNVSVLSRGVAIEQFSPAMRSTALRKSWGVHEDDVVALSVGRLAREKNISAVIKAFAAIQARLPRAKLVFVGDGPLRKPLQVECPQAVFAGMRKGAELANYYASSDLFLFPSLTETYGNVVPEAMASGLAVVSYACAAAANLITHDRNGTLVAPGDESAFVNTATALAVDAARRNRIRHEAPASVAHLSWSAVTEGFIATLRNVLERHALQFRLEQQSLQPAPMNRTSA